jgi:fatty acid/phospholipid biosynthesis enzyme
MEDKPVVGLRKKKDCSIARAIELLKDGGYYTAVLNADSGSRATFELHRLPRS